MAENLRIIVGKSSLYFSRVNLNMPLAGDVNSIEVGLQFYNGSGQSAAADQILYTEGTPGNQDFFEVKSKYNTVLNGNSFLQVIISAQFIVAPGNYVELYPVILGAPPFTLRIYSI